MPADPRQVEGAVPGTAVAARLRDLESRLTVLERAGGVPVVVPIAAAALVANSSLFVDSADMVLKYKDPWGTVRTL